MRKILFTFFISSVALAQSPVSAVSVYTDTLEPFLNASVYFPLAPIFGTPLGASSLDTTFLVTRWDTASMLSPYLQTSLLGMDTANYTAWGWSGSTIRIPLTRLAVLDRANMFTRMLEDTGTTNGATMISGASTRIEWIPSLAAFRAGRARGTEWDSANVGQWSVAIGDADTAKGQQAIALGTETSASGNESFAAGALTTASGGGSTALGYGSLAKGGYSFAGGYCDSATGLYSVTLGDNNASTGDYSVTLGDNNASTGDYNFIFGANLRNNQTSTISLGYADQLDTLAIAESFVVDNIPIIAYNGDQGQRQYSRVGEFRSLSHQQKDSVSYGWASVKTQPNVAGTANFVLEKNRGYSTGAGGYTSSRWIDFFVTDSLDNVYLNNTRSGTEFPWGNWELVNGSFGVGYVPDSSITAGSGDFKGNVLIAGNFSLTGNAILGGLTVNPNAKQNITLSDTVSITGQLNVGTSGTAQSHYIYAGVDTTFIGRQSSQYLALFGNGSNNNLLSKGSTFDVGTLDGWDLYFYRNNARVGSFTSTAFNIFQPINGTLVWQFDTTGRASNTGVSSTILLKYTNNANMPFFEDILSSTGVEAWKLDSNARLTIGNKLALKGNGVPMIVYSQDSTGITAKNTSAVTMITPTNVVHHWECGVSLTCTTLGTSSTWTIQLGYKDGSAVTYSWPTAATSSTGAYAFPVFMFRTSDNTAITAKVVVTNTAPIVNYSIFLKQLD